MNQQIVFQFFALIEFCWDYSRSISWKLEPPPPPSGAGSGCCCDEPDEDEVEVEVLVDGPADDDDDELEVAFEVLLVVEEEAVLGAVWLGGILK